MRDILDIAGHKVATIGEDGKIHSTSGVELGHMGAESHILNKEGVAVGYFDASGHVYRDTSYMGSIYLDGNVYDQGNNHVGKVVGDHMESGGAALLLLIR